MTLQRKVRSCAVLLSLLPSASVAAGFALPEQNARSTAMAGTGAASSEGAAGIFYNPAAIAFEDGIAAEASLVMLLPMLNAQVGRDEFASARSLNFAPTVFVEAPVTERLYLGLGAFSSFGARVSWPSDFPGRFDGSRSSLTTYTVNPIVSFRLNDEIGIGAGFDVVRAAVELDRQLDFASAEGSRKLGAGTFGFGGNVGVEVRMLSRQLRVGANYRSATTLSFAGTAAFDVPPELEAKLRDQDIRTTFVLPHVLSAGAGYQLNPRTLVTFELTYTTWSALRSIDLDFDDDSLDESLRRDWTNTFALKAALEHRVSRELTLRVGAGFDQTPSPDDTTSPSLPDASRMLGSVGAGYRVGNFGVDLGYLLSILLPRTTTGDAFKATYSGTAHVIALTVSSRQ